MQYSRIFGHGRLMKVVLVGLAVCIGTVATAEAGKRHNRHASVRGKVHRVVSTSDNEIVGSSRYAAIVIDDKTGKVLYAKNADALRHPASLTKMMTLYLLFEEMQKKRMTLATRLQVSRKASIQAPTKLGLKPGSTIGVEDAIRALVTRSANDVAVTIAENIGGSEEAFAKRMTKTARSIGMRGTTFYNASGLPNDAQYSTARDMVILGRALQERFPVQYRYFSTRSFAWGNSVIPNHNHVLSRLEGVDGIKTGYTGASGFNLVSSIRRDNRHLVAAVLGGSSARSRDDHMVKLLTTYLPQASAGSKVSSVFKETGSARTADAGDIDGRADDEVANAGSAKSAPVSTAPMKTAAVTPAASKPIQITPAPMQSAALALQATDEDAAEASDQGDEVPKSFGSQSAPTAPLVTSVSAHQPRIASSDVVSYQRAERETRTSTDHGAAVAMARAILLPDSGRTVRGAAETPVRTAAVAAPAPAPVTRNDEARPTKVISLADATISMAHVVPTTTGSIPRRKAEEPAQAPAPAPAAQTAHRSGWMVQIGAFDREDAARAALDKAKGNAGSVLARAEGFTETVGGGSGRLWRARFAGFADQKGADEACKALKRKEFVCLALRQ